MRHFLRQRLLLPIASQLRQGVSREQIALSVIVGVVIGIFPVLGATTILCTLAAVLLRLNLIAVHAVHYATTPLQLVLIIPFVRVGEHLAGASPQPLSISAGLALIDRGMFTAVMTLWDAIVHAVFGWLVLAPPLFALLHFTAKWLLARYARTRFNYSNPSL